MNNVVPIKEIKLVKSKFPQIELDQILSLTRQNVPLVCRKPHKKRK